MERSFPDSDPLTHEYQKVSRDKESHQSNAGPQTDFSVTNRLLQPAHVAPQSPSTPQNCTTSGGAIPGWQFLLPTDQGTVSTRHWKAEVPNATLPFTEFPQPPAVGYNGQSCTSLHGDPHESEQPHQQEQASLSGEISDSNNAEESGNETDGESSRSSRECSNAIDEPRKPKRTRTAYSNYQLDQLELVFTQTQYPDVFLREELATRLAIKEDRIQVWFQNRRARFRKQERTGSVSFRSRYRQKRLQRVLQDTRTVMAAPAYCPQLITPPCTSAALAGSSYRPAFPPTLPYPPLPGYLPHRMTAPNPPSYSTFHSDYTSTHITHK